MENRIVRDFQKLRVFTNKLSTVNMDELVHDLTFALEETSSITRARSTDSLPALMNQALKRQHKKRRSTKRRSVTTGRDSEASESSIDEALKDYMENVSVRSDSDDCTTTRRMPIIHQNIISLVESDSLTENFSPLRPLRRRRKFKRMAVDACQDDDFAIPRARISRPKRSKSRTKSDEECRSEPMEDNDGTLTRASATLGAGKRKRTYKQSGSGSGENNADEKASQSSSSLSSSEADHDEATFTQDEAREADDEQSDFFHEPGPACGIPGIIPWWEQKLEQPSPTVDDEVMSDPEFQKILTGTFNHLSVSSQRGFKARLNKILHSHGREFRYGRRRLNEKMPRYSMARYIQDKQKWKESSTLKYPPGWPGAVMTSTETKRRRKTPPTSGGEVGSTPEPDPPIPDTNIGNQMLQMMGWSVGTGLGPGGSGIKVPVTASCRPKRQGLGYDMDDDS